MTLSSVFVVWNSLRLRRFSGTAASRADAAHLGPVTTGHAQVGSGGMNMGPGR